MKMHLDTKLAFLCTIVAFFFCGCKPKSETMSFGSSTDEVMTTVAVATLNPTQGHNVKGTVTFTKVDSGVRVVADIAGLKPGEHGFHIHENGDCSAPDASSAGGHFNPTGMPHGGPDSEEHHLGDMGNITADASGRTHLDRVFSFLELSGANSIVGHAVIVHGGQDDLTSQPSGNAGVRVACGVIEMK